MAYVHGYQTQPLYAGYCYTSDFFVDIDEVATSPLWDPFPAVVWRGVQGREDALMTSSQGMILMPAETVLRKHVSINGFTVMGFHSNWEDLSFSCGWKVCPGLCSDYLTGELTMLGSAAMPLDGPLDPATAWFTSNDALEIAFMLQFIEQIEARVETSTLQNAPNWDMRRAVSPSIGPMVSDSILIELPDLGVV